MGAVAAIAFFWSSVPNPAIKYVFMAEMMGVVIEIFVKYPGGPTRIKATDLQPALIVPLQLTVQRVSFRPRIGF
jgi:hypothetical protein